MASIAVVAFAKNPLKENCKTRLLQDLQSVQQCLNVYELLLRITNETLINLQNSNEGIDCFWAINSNPDELPKYFSESIKLVEQGDGELGQRLHYVYSQLKSKYDQVIVIGSDLPTLNTGLIRKVISLLKNNSYVFGPSEDGGFYLFGSNQELPQIFWTEPRYSQTDTLAQMTQKLNPSAVALNEMLSDIDDMKSFYVAMNELKQFINLSSTQLELIHLYQEILLSFKKDLANQKNFSYADNSL